MFELHNRVALVTGASGGIGTAIAQALHRAGAAVALSGTRETALRQLADRLEERAHVVVANLAGGGDAGALVKETEAALGPIDVLVNNAGITRDGLALRMKDDDWQAVLDVNLTAAFRLTRAALRGMMRRRSGRIINISSVSGLLGNPGQANYAASKAGLIGMSKALALEVATRGITVNCLAPGFIETAMTDALPEAVRDDALARVPMGRFGSPEDIGAAAVYLASDEAGYLTGQTLTIAGGLG
ncbi:MAG: 3-oxoacyl-[acyl-carrier-protein] reductase [Rhodospirillales bacterium]|nr:3-oxoacyl-[acyl-carrier-protein] reductase [Rhodospirillales bacterium]MDE0713139.1 3-oxoacyl-[acyl-carrier-protein] reductase [Rhodospirillales bacterium]